MGLEMVTAGLWWEWPILMWCCCAAVTGVAFGYRAFPSVIGATIRDMADENEDGEDIGHGVRIRYAEYKGERCAIHETHLKPSGQKCRGFVPFRCGAWDRDFNSSIASWEVINRDPLTLAPSILCRACGNHGFIQNGRWVPA